MFEERSARALPWLGISIFSTAFGWLLGAMILNWHSGRGEGGDVIGSSFVSGVVVALLSVPLVLTGVGYAFIGLILGGYRILSASIILFDLLLVIWLIKGPQRAKDHYAERRAAEAARTAPRTIARSIPIGVALAGDQARLPPHIEDISFSADGGLILAAGRGTRQAPEDPSVQVWSRYGTFVKSFAHPAGEPHLLNFGHLVEETRDGLIVQNLLENVPSRSFGKPQREGQLLGLIPGTDILIRQVENQTGLQLWDLASASEVLRITDPEALSPVAIDKQVQTIAAVGVGSKQLHLISTASRAARVIALPNFAVSDAIFAMDGSSVVLSGVDARGGTLVPVPAFVTIDLQSGRPQRFFAEALAASARVIPLFLSSDGARLTATDLNKVIVLMLAGETASVRKAWQARVVAVSKDGRYIASGTTPDEIQFASGDDGTFIRSEPLTQFYGAARPDRILFSPDNRTILIRRGEVIELHDVEQTGGLLLGTRN
jgi:hypothetical protein